MKKRRATWLRPVLVCLGMIAWMGVILLRLADLQLVRAEEYRDKAVRQQQRVVELEPPRGTIFDRRGRPLAVSVSVESAFAVPARIDDSLATARALAPILADSTADIEPRLTADRSFSWVERKLEPEQSGAIRELDLAGIDFVRESRRYYPNGSLAAGLLGFVGTDDEGLGGIEAGYDAVVTGDAVQRRVVRDARGAWVTAEERAFSEPEPGDDLHLTIDAVVQHIAESELAATVERSGARGGAVILLDPNNGEVLAMASLPTFDPNRYQRASASARRLRPVSDVFEPGSTFKVITLAAAMADHLVSAGDEFDCGNGNIVLGNGKRVRDHHAYDRLTVTEIIAKSSNVGAIRIGQVAGRQRLYDTLTGFGFGRETGIDVPGESRGLIRELDAWDKYAHDYAAFGHGVAVTSLQLVNAFAAIANGGTLYKPRVVRAVGDAAPALPEVLGTAVDRATSLSLERILEVVVEEGTAKSAAVPGYRVAGKTGTPQKLTRDGRGYSHRLYMPSFVGFAPARDPRVVGLVLIDEPGAAEEGGVVAAPTFRRIVERVFRYWRLPPDDSWPPEVETEPGTVLAAADLATGVDGVEG